MGTLRSISFRLRWCPSDSLFATWHSGRRGGGADHTVVLRRDSTRLPSGETEVLLVPIFFIQDQYPGLLLPDAWMSR